MGETPEPPITILRELSDHTQTLQVCRSDKWLPSLSQKEIGKKVRAQGLYPPEDDNTEPPYCRFFAR